MSDALLVRGVQRVADLPGVLHRLIDRQRTFQRSAVNVLHHQVIRPDVVELANVRMIQRGDRTRFPLEALRKLLLGDFDRDGAIKPCIAGLVHLAHAAFAQRRQDLVGTEFVASVQHWMSTLRPSAVEGCAPGLEAAPKSASKSIWMSNQRAWGTP